MKKQIIFEKVHLRIGNKIFPITIGYKEVNIPSKLRFCPEEYPVKPNDYDEDFDDEYELDEKGEKYD